MRIGLALVVCGLALACTPSGSGRPCERDGDCPIGDSCDEGTCRFTGRYPIPRPVVRDAGVPRDSGAPALDAGTPLDAGLPSDGGADAGTDAGTDAGPAWWDPAWPRRTKIRIHAVGFEESLAGHAVAVPLADAIPADRRTVGDTDLRFVDADDVTVLPHELEAPGTDAIAWVRVPVIDADTSEDFVWLYWGNPDATDAQDPAAVWQGYEAVLHLDSAVDGTLHDSTGNGHDAPVGTTTATSGVAGGGRALTGAGGLTPQGLAGADFPQDEGTVFLFGRTADRTLARAFLDTRATGNQLVIETNGSGSVAFRSMTNSASVQAWTSSIYDDSWTALAFAWSASDNVLRPYRDGNTASPPLSLGAFRPTNQQAVFGATLTGGLDELRVARVPLNAQQLDAVRASTALRMAIVGEPPVPPVAPPRTLARVADTTALWDFDEGGGTVALDVGAAGLSLDLALDEPGRVQWFEGGVWTRGRVMFSRDDAPGLASECEAGDLTVEAWLMADNVLNDGPSRVLTFSLDTSYRNFTLGQESGRWVLRHVTSTSDQNGDENPAGGIAKPRTPADSVTPGTPQHVVFVREAGTFTTWLDGVNVDTRAWGGDVLGAWDDTYGIGVANEFGKDRSWLGAVYLLAVYCRALDPAEVQQNFAAGP